MTLKSAVIAMLLAAALPAAGAFAQPPASVRLSVKNHRFQPAEISAPAKVPIVLHVKNLDATPMEFESGSLRAEKIITGKGSGIVRLQPLAPGRYEFFDDFHQSAKGVLVVR